MKITYEKKEEQSKPAKDIAVGTVFSGAIGDCEGVFAKTYDRIVDLANMSLTWDFGDDCAIGVKRIDNYKELNVTLLVEGEK